MITYYAYLTYIVNPDGDALFAKVGVSKNPADRIKTYRTHNPFTRNFNRIWEFLDKSHAIHFEELFLEMFSDSRVDEREWVEVDMFTQDYEDIVHVSFVEKLNLTHPPIRECFEFDIIEYEDSEIMGADTQ